MVDGWISMCMCTSSVILTDFPAAPLNSFPLSVCKIAGAPMKVKMSSSANATAVLRLDVKARLS